MSIVLAECRSSTDELSAEYNLTCVLIDRPPDVNWVAAKKGPYSADLSIDTWLPYETDGINPQ